MKDKMKALQTKLEIRQAEKKGAVSIETIIVAALLITLAVGLLTAFSTTASSSATQSNKVTANAVNKAVTAATANQSQSTASINVAP